MFEVQGYTCKNLAGLKQPFCFCTVATACGMKSLEEIVVDLYNNKTNYCLWQICSRYTFTRPETIMIVKATSSLDLCSWCTYCCTCGKDESDPSTPLPKGKVLWIPIIVVKVANTSNISTRP